MGRKKSKQITNYINAINTNIQQPKTIGYNESYTRRNTAAFSPFITKEGTH